MSIIKVSKKIEQLSKEEFLEQAIKEIQLDMKSKGKVLQFDIEEYKNKIRNTSESKIGGVL